MRDGGLLSLISGIQCCTDTQDCPSSFLPGPHWPHKGSVGISQRTQMDCFMAGNSIHTSQDHFCSVAKVMHRLTPMHNSLHYLWASAGANLFILKNWICKKDRKNPRGGTEVSPAFSAFPSTDTGTLSMLLQTYNSGTSAVHPVRKV